MTPTTGRDGEAPEATPRAYNALHQELIEARRRLDRQVSQLVRLNALSRQLLHHELHEEFAQLISEAYHETNRWLIAQQVLPEVDLRPFIKRSRTHPNANLGWGGGGGGSFAADGASSAAMGLGATGQPRLQESLPGAVGHGGQVEHHQLQVWRPGGNSAPSTRIPTPGGGGRSPNEVQF